jgi:4-amino-4-deoxy-L-arabinose transferase-like glycosyltransferase
VSAKLRKVFGGIILTILWVCGFLFIRPTLVFDFGAGITVNLKFAVAVIGLLIIVLYHIFYRSSTEITKLSLTCSLTIAWLAVVFFYPFQPNQGTEAAYAAGKIYDGAVGFFTLLSGLAVCVLWVRFFADDIKIEE